MLSTLIALVVLTSPPPDSPCATPAANLVHAHLTTVEAELLAADTTHLTAALRARRAAFIKTLATYRDRCQFPQNTLAPDRLVTVFVDKTDDQNTHCAVGFLMATDGRSDLVERIHATRNTATIWELADDPEVADWVAGSGLSLYEAARIQPGYCFTNFGGTCLCGGHSQRPTGVAEGTIATLELEGEVTVTLTAVHGTGATVGEVRRATRLGDDTVGRRVLIMLSETVLADRGPAFVGTTDDVTCISGYGSDPTYKATVPTDVYVTALLSEDCIGSLETHDPDLGLSVCDIDSPSAGGSGCSTTPFAPWALSTCLLMLLSFRRARRHRLPAMGR
jgi:hypothetical protein